MAQVHPRVLPPASILLCLLLVLGVSVRGWTQGASTYTFSHFAGAPPGGCAADGSALQVPMSIGGMAVRRSDGVIFYGDTGRYVVRQIDAGGRVSTVAGLREADGTVDGSGPGARLERLEGLALHPDGSLFISSAGLLRRLAPDGRLTTFAPLAGHFVTVFAIDAVGAVYARDGHRVIKVLPTGELVPVAGHRDEAGSRDGMGHDARFESINGLAVDAAGYVYVSDGYYTSYKGRVTSRGHTVRRINPEGYVTTVAGLAGSRGWVDGTGSDARFFSPGALSVGSDGAIYVADHGNRAIRRVTLSGTVLTVASNIPSPVAVDASSDILVATFTQIWRLPADGRHLLVAGVESEPGFLDGVGQAARLASPVDLAFDVQRHLFVAEQGNQAIRRIDPDGRVSTVVGGPGGPAGPIDGSGSGGRLGGPRGIATDLLGNVFIADTPHVIRKLTPDGVLTTIAGLAGVCGTADGAASEARFCDPMDVAVDRLGAVYVADSLNHAIRKILPSGQVVTAAGRTGEAGSVDGAGPTARFRHPESLAFGADGTLYVADRGNHTLRAIRPDGDVITLAGLAGQPGTIDGAGSAARFEAPDTVAVGPDGQIFVADFQTIRRVTPAGAVHTIVRQQWLHGCEDGPAASARFGLWMGLAVGDEGSLFVADYEYSSIRRGTPATLPPPTIARLSSTPGSTSLSTPVTIVGSGFAHDGLRVFFEHRALADPIAGPLIREEALSVQVISDTELVAVAPPSAAVLHNVVVTTAAGEATLPGGLPFVAPVTVTARALTASTGTGSGIVWTESGEIRCTFVAGVPQTGGPCEAQVEPGTRLVFSATPSRGSTFNGWYSPCHDQGPCVITATGDTTVWTTFVEAPYARYFAEGAATDFFEPHFAIANESDELALVSLRYLPGDGSAEKVEQVSLPPRGVRHVWPGDATGGPTGAGPSGAFATVLESYRPITVERTMRWDQAAAFGGHSETAIEAPATTWYFAEGATHSGFDLFYLLANPGADAADVEITYLLPAPASPVVKQYVVPAGQRFTIWVDQEDARLVATDVSAVVRSGVPVVAERAMYLGLPGQIFGAGTVGAGVAEPGTTWMFAEGATGTFFDTFVLVANADAREAAVEAQYLLPDGSVITRSYAVAPRSRLTIWVDAQDPRLVETAVALRLESTNGVPVVAERAMWWPGPGFATWAEGHLAAGATVTGREWIVSDGEVDAATGLDTYILVANMSAVAGNVALSVRFEDGTVAHRDYALAPWSRMNVPIGFAVPEATNRRFAVVIESQPAPGASEADTPAIVVERATYWNAPAPNGVMQFWAAGTCARAARIR